MSDMSSVLDDKLPTDVGGAETVLPPGTQGGDGSQARFLHSLQTNGKGACQCRIL